jgi:small subunit ribosomal protein S17
MPKKELIGEVVSDKMQKTIVVRVARVKLHPKYKRRFLVHKKYKVHDPREEAKVGDIVLFRESSPISKTKKWVLLKIIKKGEIKEEKEEQHDTNENNAESSRQ